MSETEGESFDPKRRRLCPDGGCVGVIGEGGTCRVCGTRDEAAPGLGPEVFAGACVSDDDDFGSPVVASAEPDDLEAAALAFDPERQLCLDGGCVGVIRADGFCSECGRPSGPAASAE